DRLRRDRVGQRDEGARRLDDRAAGAVVEVELGDGLVLLGAVPQAGAAERQRPGAPLLDDVAVIDTARAGQWALDEVARDHAAADRDPPGAPGAYRPEGLGLGREHALEQALDQAHVTRCPRRRRRRRGPRPSRPAAPPTGRPWSCAAARPAP